MAELAAGAVSSLLGVLQNEARLLGRVEGDMRFIREEMESMNSFLLHLARTVPPGGKHDEQVRTWMNQVRLLAQDCNNFIDIYVYRENPDFHIGKKGFWRCVLWIPWFLKKTVAQHFAAGELEKLKERARDVGERRVRYGVDIPPPPTSSSKSPSGRLAGDGHGLTPAATTTIPAAATAQGEQDEDENGDDDGLAVEATVTGHRARAALLGLFGAQDLDDYFNGRLADWIKEVEKQSNTQEGGEEAPFVATVVAPGNRNGALALAEGARDSAAKVVGFRSVLINISKVHYPYNAPLQPEDSLCYLWRELELEEEKDRQARCWYNRLWRSSIYRDKEAAIQQIIKDTKVVDKIEEIKKEIEQVSSEEVEQLKEVLEEPEELKNKISEKRLSVLLLQLREAAAKQDQTYLVDHMITETARKLMRHIPVEAQEEGYYEGILRDVFLRKQQEQSPATTTTTTEHHLIQGMIQDAKEEILREVQKMLGDKSDIKQEQAAGGDHTAETNSDTNKSQGQSQIHQAHIAETMKKLYKIQLKIHEPLKIQGIMGRIRRYLKGKRALVIFNVQTECKTTWEDIRGALSQLGCVAGVVIVTTSAEYCHPSWEPMEHSLVGMYHDIVLRITRERMNEDEGDNHIIDPKIFHDILNECRNNELCMKIFAYALYANPKRSSEELRKLLKTLQHAQKAPSKSFVSIAKKMFKFAYRDLPKEYMTCLLYLSIFPRGHKIRRSTLIGRWVAEGLITTEDWSWQNSVREAERCFVALINRSLVYPEDIDAIGKVKSCRVGDLVHELITELAKKQRIVETRLSHHLARHFSISNNLHLRGSDKIEKFFKRISESSQFFVLKVLDLEGCSCFNGKDKRYLKVICHKILLLKYLSLRRTDVTMLPKEINNLHELEVLDIRQTKMQANATRHVQLLKLKRLLADNIDPSPSGVLVPEKIENMLSMEVLSNVKPKIGGDLNDIGKLWQLRKLCVVIENDNHLSKLVRAISNLHDCLCSLLITLPEGAPKGNFAEQLPDDICNSMEHPPENLESLSISGITQTGQLLPLLATTKSTKLTKVTLNNTWLCQKDLKFLATLPMLHYLKLRHKAYNDRELTFKKDGFNCLKYFLVEGSNVTHIIFEVGATPELEKLFLPFTGDLQFSGLENLPKLEELELKNSYITTTTNDKNNTTSNNSTTPTSNNAINSSGNTTTTTTTTTNNNNNNATNRSGNNTVATSTSNNDSTLLSTFCNAKQLTKVTLSGTLLKNGDLQNLAKNPNICYLMLLDKSYVENELTFNSNANFPKLNLLIVNCPNITKITFNNKCTPKINKIVWSFIEIESLSGLGNLLKLRELEFIGEFVPIEVKQAIKKHKSKPYYLHNIPERLDQASGHFQEEDEDKTPFICWRNKM